MITGSCKVKGKVTLYRTAKPSFLKPLDIKFKIPVKIAKKSY